MSITKNSGEVTDVLSGRLTFEKSKDRLVGRNDDNIMRLLILANGEDFIMKISKEGFDALTATDAQLIFNSANNLFKIAATNTASFGTTSAGSSGAGFQKTIDIDTGVTATVPLIALCFAYAAGQPPLMLPLIETMSGPTFGGYIAYRMDATPYVNVVDNEMHITIRMNNYIGSILPSLTVRWYLLQETAQ